MSIVETKSAIFESVLEMDKDKMNKVFDYIKLLNQGDNLEREYENFKEKAMLEIREALVTQ